MNKRAFTLVEILVVVGVLAILGAVSAAGFITFQRQTDLGSTAEKIISSLRSAQNKTLASEGPSRYGVYFNNTASPHQYVLFTGSSYGSRAATADQVFRLPTRVEFYEINLAGGNEVVFNRINASTDVSGNVRIRLTTDTSKTASIYIDNSGRVGLTNPAAPSETGLTKYSRHIHFNYTRQIQLTETITLSFDGGTATKNLLVSSYMNTGNFEWEGEVSVAGSIQKIKIHTHIFNQTGTNLTQFCVHRDERYNNKSLSIAISGDATGNLISYTADGQETRGTSFNLSGEPERQ